MYVEFKGAFLLLSRLTAHAGSARPVLASRRFERRAPGALGQRFAQQGCGQLSGRVVSPTKWRAPRPTPTRARATASRRI